MDGDIIDLPRMVALCRKYGAYLMMDEAHSVGVLGKTGRGIEEHFDMVGAIDIKMGTLSKTIPSVGGYVPAKRN
jgi:7-keto-8-aminopelargonate synthetase-like enzyme